MYVTLHLSDGRKITKERDNLIILRPQTKFKPEAEKGKITVNWGIAVAPLPAAGATSPREISDFQRGAAGASALRSSAGA